MQKLAYSVLIADDEATIRNGLVEAIPWELYNARVIGMATNGEEALATILSMKPDLTVIDIKMPGLDGLEVIRRAGEYGSKTRFIILSGYDDFSLAQKAIRYGACAYFLKPLKIQEFRDELSRQFQEISAHKQLPDNHANIAMLIRSSRVFLLNQLILNELHSQEEIDRRIEMVSLQWLNGSYRVLVCTAVNVDVDSLSAAQGKLQALLAGVSHEVWIHGGDMLVAMIGGDDAGFAPVRDAVTALLAALKEETGLRFYASVGKLVQGAESAAKAYTSALRALSYHLYEQPGDLYDDSMVCHQEPPFDPESVSCEALVGAMELADTAVIHEFCCKYLNELFFVPMPPPDFVRSMCIHLVNNARIQFLSRHPGFTPMMPVHPEEVRQCHTVEDLCGWMEKRICMLAEQYRQSRDANDPIITRAKTFIRKNISANIKARDVAADVNLSESYFTVYFKQKTGENFRDYLLAVRIDLARQLLAEGRLNIGEIAAAAGYQDYRSFSRAFKNVTGSSPSEYQGT
ncbi:MAG: helix-turn-helix domain-containing protein [Clostridia bacterium]|nr:helix-turn-helix domain-containing protein [Clostridia bacterium]